jgi:chloride channel protein, CIC family
VTAVSNEAQPDVCNPTRRPCVSEPFVPERPISREDEKRVNLLILCGLALVVGVMTGCGAVALRALIGLFHNAFFNAE